MQLYRYFVRQSSEFCRHNPLCCFSTSSSKGKRVFRYRLNPETFGYTLVHFCRMNLFEKFDEFLAILHVKYELHWTDTDGNEIRRNILIADLSCKIVLKSFKGVRGEES